MRQSDSQQNLAQKIEKWKAGLADLGKRNPLIKFRQDSPRSLEILIEQPGDLFKHLIKEKKVLCFQTDVRVSATNRLETCQSGDEQLKRLKRLRSEARLSLEERGVNSLFLAFGTLNWYDKDRPEDPIVSPLLLVPVTLIKEPRRDVYKISLLEEDFALNPTLALKLKQTFGIELPESEAIQETSYAEIINQVRQLVFEQKTWQTQERVFLSLFSYSKATMVRDIIENESRILAHPILQAISGNLDSYQATYREPLPATALDSQIKPEQTFQILDADSSQQVVIQAAKSGSSFVVQGPPGTGKSQTIVNMIAELIGDGKSVLLVAEKDTALRVVYQRMAECGLHHLCLNLHHSGTTDKRKLVEDLSKTIEYVESIAQSPEKNRNDDFFRQLVTTRDSVSSYLASLHTEEAPLEKTPFELFGTLLQMEREEVPEINVVISNFNQWSQGRLGQAKNLLNQLAQFLPFFTGEKTTIWAKSNLSCYSYELELKLREKIGELQQALTSIQETGHQLGSKLQLQPFSNLESSTYYAQALCQILSAPLQIPENWTSVNLSIAHQAFEILNSDVKEIEKHQLSPEASNLLTQLSHYLPFLREETTIWKRSKTTSCSEAQQLEIQQQFSAFLEELHLAQSASQVLQNTLNITFLLNLEEIEKLIPALNHILAAPSRLPENWSRSPIRTLQNKFATLNQDVAFLEEQEPALQHKYATEIFSSDLAELNSRMKRYSRFWLFRIFNPNYRRDMKRLRKLYRQEGQVSYDELKRDLDRALEVQTKRNELYQDQYAGKAFGRLFNSEFSKESELNEIEKSLQWLTELQSYSISATSLEDALESTTLRQELIQAIQTLKRTAENFDSFIRFVVQHFHKSEFSPNTLPVNQVPFAELAAFLNLAIADLPKFQQWLTFRAICDRLEQLGHTEFIHALRENRESPTVVLQNKLNQPDYLPRQVFGALYNPNVFKQADLKPLQDALNWLVNIQPYSLPALTIQQILDSPPQRRELTELANRLEIDRANVEKGLGFVLSYFSEDQITDSYQPRSQIQFSDLKSFLDTAETELSDFQEWLTYRETCESLESLGIKKFLDSLRDNKLDSKRWFSTLERLIYQTCLNAVLAQKPELRNFNFEVHERQIREFNTLDYNQLEIARNRLKYLHAGQWQNWEKTSVAQAEIGNLKRESTRRRMHLPIRKLLNDQQQGVQHLAKTLKPCWMMSPLSVSQYIDPNTLHFDVLIFDEASQLRTEDVISAILRADQVIVIGDNKQLPPTSFFATGESEEDTESESDAVYESILDECSNFMFPRKLKWHYRSQDERLIAFSNRHFYDSQLVTFPNPIKNSNLGVWFEEVTDGIYDRSGRRDNQREARRVAELALKHVQQAPDQSLGIVAFSEAQAEAIQQQIEIRGKDNPELEEFCRDNTPRYFLKALENVQGDERDVIILSVCYARDAEGRFSLNFGPLNKQGGERRLNVAITRAKNKITLVAAIRARDIDLTRTNSKGVRLLRDYLEYADSGGERLQTNSYTDELQFDSPFEEDVYYFRG
ncbi:hypothetical protein LEP3755_11000 [Leptolyngbya sp. NIES-3755]|nr:hypothetical protein LEP3755_11000 [Leptolyngbya sp. NIES-3755]